MGDENILDMFRKLDISEREAAIASLLYMALIDGSERQNMIQWMIDAPLKVAVTCGSLLELGVTKEEIHKAMEAGKKMSKFVQEMKRRETN